MVTNLVHWVRVGLTLSVALPATAESTPIAPIGVTVENAEGVRVSRVRQGSPAEIGGIEVDDVVLTFGGVDVGSPGHLVELVMNGQALASAGAAIHTDVKRSGIPISVDLDF